jgi:ATP-dependent HslUV protease ATP-binding subunit HslU
MMGFSTDPEPSARDNETRQKFRKMLREGSLNDREVEIDLRAIPAGVQIMAPPGMERNAGAAAGHVRQPGRKPYKTAQAEGEGSPETAGRGGGSRQAG